MDTIGPLLTKMQEVIPANVTSAKESKPTPRGEIPLQPQMIFEPFDKWGMDFIGPINPPSGKKKYIIMCNDYLTKWVETKAVKVAT